MIIGVPKEIKLQEHRIGLTPESVKALTNKQHEVLVQDNGGFEAGFTNEDYLAAGAQIIQTPEEIFQKAELIALFIKSSVIFASSKTIKGLFPPISNPIVFKLLSPEYFIKRPPTSVDPVNETASTSSCLPNASPTSPKPGITFKTPSGIPASLAI